MARKPTTPLTLDGLAGELERLAAEARRLAGGEPAADAVPTPVAVADDANEFRRRCRVLSARAERSSDGPFLICPFCGGSRLGNRRMVRHLKDTHADQVKALPASRFD